MAVGRTWQVPAFLNVRTKIGRRFGGLGTIVMVPPTGVTVPNLTGIAVAVLDLTETVVRARHVIVSHVAMQNTSMKNGEERELAWELQSKMIKVRTFSNSFVCTFSFGHLEFKRDRTVVISFCFSSSACA